MRGLSDAAGRRSRRLTLLRAVPRRALSRAVGALARARVPQALLRPAIAAYVRGFGVDLSEAEPPAARWPSFVDFFARRLREGVRVADPDPLAIVSPVDGRVHASGRLERGETVPVKGAPYSLADLLGSAEDARALEGGTFAALYLAPRDYHRIHWPFDARVRAVRHLPGDLWPVDAAAVDGVPRLFVRNERAAIVGEAGGGAFALVAVGALNVGSIRLAFHALRTNRFPAGPRRYVFDPPLSFRRGEECGWFELGSAVVLGCSPAAGILAPLERHAPVRVGLRIGRLTSRGA
jgi:phosphatidylserine decarboxylase